MKATWLLGRRGLLVCAGLAAGLGAFVFACGSDGDPPSPSACEAGCAEAGAEGGGLAVDAGADGTSADAAFDAGDGGGGGDAGDGGTACSGPPGTLDPTFGDGGMVVLPFAGASAESVIVQPDGKVLIGGGTSPQKFALVRLLPNGALDPTFGTGGIVETKVGANLNKSYTALAVQADGKIIAVGSANPEIGQRSYDFAVVRYMPDGTLDPTFGNGGSVTTPFGTLPFTADTPTAIALLADGRILVGGYTVSGDLTVGDMAFARYTVDGLLDPMFGTGGLATVDIRGTADQARGIALLGGGKILAAGTSRDPSVSRTDVAAVRMDGNGNIDTSFANGGRFVTAFGGPGSQGANALAVDLSGRPLLFGFYGVAGPRDFLAIRLTTAGQLDPSFGIGGMTTTDFQGRSDDGNAVILQEDGEAVFVGSSLPTGPTPEPRIALARHVADGGIDLGFGVGGKTLTPLPQGFSGAPANRGVRAGCSIVTVGGWFDELAGGVPKIGVVRYRR